MTVDNTPNILARHHLFDALDVADLARLVIIYAPAGVGKTALARQLPQAMGIPAVWHSLDQWQHDVATLHRHCIYAWREQLKDATFALSEHKIDPYDAAELLTDYLAQHLAEDDHYLYVIDDVQHISQQQPATRWLQVLIDRLPPQVHLVLVGRELPSLTWVSLVSRGQVTVIDDAQLRFTVDELQGLRPDLSREQATALVAQYEGWISGMLMALEQGDQPEYTPLYTPETHDAIFERLALSMLHTQEEPLQEFLLATSTPVSFTPMMAADLLDLDSKSVTNYIALLGQRSLFLQQHHGAYAYHQSFRQALQSYCKAQRPDDYQRWHLKMAMDADTRDAVESTVYHFLEAGQPLKAAAKAQDVASEFYRGGRWQALLTLQRMVRDYPAPRLNLLSGLVLGEMGDFTEANTLLDRARVGFERVGDHENVLRAEIQYAFTLHRMGRNDKALEKMNAVLNNPHVVANKDLRGWAWRTRALVYRDTGYLRLAGTDIETALMHFNKHDDRNTHTQLLLDLTDLYVLSGRFDQAEETIRRSVNLAKNGQNKYDLGIALNDRGYLQHLKGQYDSAARTLTDALQALAASGSRAASTLSWTLGDVRRDQGAFDSAYQHYMDAYEYARRSDTRLHNAVCLSIARMRFWQEMDGDAQVWLKAIRHNPEDARVQHISQMAKALRLAREALQVRPDADSLAQFREVMDDFQKRQMSTKLAQVLGLYAAIGLRYRDEDLMEDVQTRLLALAPQFYQPVAADLVHLPDALPTFREYFASELEGPLQELDIMAEALDAIVRNRKPDAARLTVHQIKLETLGSELVTHNGQTISVKQWKIAPARELFFYLHVNGPSSARQIMNDFWPGRDEKSARQAVADTVKYARRALDVEDVIELIQEDARGIRNCYCLNPKLAITWDVDRFLNYLGRADDLPPNDTRAEDLYRRALALYRGEFLPSIFSPWVTDLREKLIIAYREALMSMGWCVEQRDDIAGAVPHYERVVAEDPTYEPGTEALMMVYGKLGRAVDIRKAYNKLADCLKDELDLEPSRETVLTMHEALEEARRHP